MAHKNWQQVKDTFHEALRHDSAERDEYLNDACGGDIEFRIEVESLLISLTEAKSFLEQPVTGEVPRPTSGWQLENGQIISHYRIISPIASGGMGDVYLAEDEQLGRKAALKVLPEDLLENRERLQRFQREAQVVSALNHPNILTIFEFGKVNDIRFLASEYVNGETLRERLEKGRLGLNDALDIAVQIVSALKAAHEAGVVHRDIKPENVMIRDDGYVKVLDFGLAKLAPKPTVDFEADTKRIFSKPGIIMGTVTYMSPEQARARPIDARSDLFSFGIVLFEILTGRVPFAGETMTDVIAAIIQKKPRLASSYNSAVPEDMDRMIAKCLEKDRDERYQTAADLLADLKRLSKRSDAVAEPVIKAQTAVPHAEQRTEILAGRPTGSVSTISQPPKIRKTLLAGIGALILLTLTGLGYWYYSNLKTATLISSIAVMPFVNESGNTDVEYLSDGMTESLINSLSKLPDLSVKARNTVFRYKGADIDERKIGQDLSVQAVLLGRITQRGDDLTLFLSLVDARTGNSLWGEQYDRRIKDLAALQRDITRDVSQKLRTRLSNADQKILTKNYTENAEAYQLYLKGRYFWNRRTPEDFQKSRDYFQRAIDLDPTYALAYAGLADFYGLSTNTGLLPPNETWPKQEALVRKALELDPNLAEAYNSLAGLKRSYYRDWEGAEQAFKRAIELNPNYAEAHTHYGGLLTILERFYEALAERKRAIELDPFAPSHYSRLADTYYRMRRYDEAIEQYRKALEFEAGSIMAHDRLGNAYEQKGMLEQAIAEWSAALTLSKNGELAATLERTFREAGFDAAVRAVARVRLAKLNEKMRRGEYTPARDVARLYMRLGDHDQTLEWLEKAADELNGLAPEIKFDPVFVKLSDDPRFQEVLRRVGLPQ
ncbi:MAG: protein kinase [Pyrinomonadaceae bacterium]